MSDSRRINRLPRVRPFRPLDPYEEVPKAPPQRRRLGLQLYRVDIDRRPLSRRELVAVLGCPR